MRFAAACYLLALSVEENIRSCGPADDDSFVSKYVAANVIVIFCCCVDWILWN